MLKKIFVKMFAPWWKPLLMAAICVLIPLLHDIFDLDVPILFLLLFLVPLFLVTGEIYQLFNKNWWQAGITAVPLIIIIILLSIIAYNYERHTTIEKQYEEKLK